MPRLALAATLVATLALSGCLRPHLTRLHSSATPRGEIRMLVEASAGKKHRPLPGLSPSRFSIFEDEAARSDWESLLLVKPWAASVTVDALLLIDTSGSTTAPADVDRLVAAAEAFAAELDPAANIAAWTFDGRPQPQELHPFSVDRLRLLSDLDTLKSAAPPDRSTAIHSNVAHALATLDQRRQDHCGHHLGFLVVFTDGHHRAGIDGSAAYPALEQTGIDQTAHLVYTIGLGQEIERDTLTRYGRDGFRWARGQGGLNRHFARTAQRVRARADSYYELRYCSPSRTGTHTVTAQLKRNLARDHAWARFQAEPSWASCADPHDWVALATLPEWVGSETCAASEQLDAAASREFQDLVDQGCPCDADDADCVADAGPICVGGMEGDGLPPGGGIRLPVR